MSPSPGPTSSESSPLRWIEAVLPQPSTSVQGACCLEFPQGMKLTLSHEAQLPLAARLIALLAGPNSQPHLYA